MSKQPSHTAKSLLRHIIAAGMTALYLLMVFSPLASFAMHGTKSAAMGIRECVRRLQPLRLFAGKQGLPDLLLCQEETAASPRS